MVRQKLLRRETVSRGLGIFSSGFSSVDGKSGGLANLESAASLNRDRFISWNASGLICAFELQT